MLDFKISISSNFSNLKVMKKNLLALLLTIFYLNGFSATLTIVNVGLTFSPAAQTINLGDNVTFVIGSAHNVIEVSQSDWNSNMNTLMTGGFSLSFGGGSVPATQLPVGTHYYVCGPHASLGMKGMIKVQAIAGIEEHKTINDISIYPSVIKDNNLSIQFENLTNNEIEIKLFNLQGKLVTILLPKTEVSGLFLRKFSLYNVTSPGVYFVQILSDKNNIFKKVVIL